MPYSRWLARLLLVIHTLAALALGWFAVQHPLANWDLVPYAALVQREEGVDAQLLSQAAHDDVRDYIGEARFTALIAGGTGEAAYQAAMFRDPAAFEENLRFYEVKPLYIALAKLADQITGNAAAAAVMVSAAAFALALAIFPLYFQRRVLAIAGAWALVVLGVPPLWLAATAATPDTLSLLLVTACAMAAVAGRHGALVAVLGLLAVLARPDAAFILCPLMLGLAWIRRTEGGWKAPAACMAAFFALFAFLGTQALPWPTLFHHTFFERLTHPVTGAVPPLTVARYLGVVSVTLPNALELRVIFFVLAAAALAVVPWLRDRRIAVFQVLAASALAGMVLHFLVFPVDEFGHERLFMGSYFLVLAALLVALEKKAR